MILLSEAIKRKISVFLPESIEDLEQIPYLTKTLGKSKKALERAKYLLHRIYVTRTDPKGFVRLRAEKIAREMGGTRSWTRLCKALIEAGWIEKDCQYIKGIKSQGYRLNSELLARKWVKSGEWQVTLRTKSDRIQGLDLDDESALATLASLNRSDRSKASILNAIERFSSDFYIGAKTGRLFTSTNSLPLAIRKHVTINGEPTCEIDVTNCQPLLMCCLYIRPSKEKAAYQCLVESGQLYENIMKHTGFTRKQAKKAFVVWLGGGMSPKIRMYFKDNWPELFAACQQIKKVGRVALCYTTQRLESEILVQEFSRRYTGAYVSIHDGILLEAAREIEGIGILKEIFSDFHRLNASIHRIFASSWDGAEIQPLPNCSQLG